MFRAAFFGLMNDDDDVDDDDDDTSDTETILKQLQPTEQ